MVEVKIDDGIEGFTVIVEVAGFELGDAEFGVAGYGGMALGGSGFPRTDVFIAVTVTVVEGVEVNVGCDAVFFGFVVVVVCGLLSNRSVRAVRVDIIDD